jgi:hypothetical protein
METAIIETIALVRERSASNDIRRGCSLGHGMQPLKVVLITRGKG